MKKLFILIFIFTLLLTGCNKKNTKIPTENDNSTIESIVETQKNISNEKLETTDLDYKDDKSKNIIEIKEKMFISQVNDIYINKEDYLGKTIKIEGIFSEYYYDVTDKTYYYVMRYGPGCCGDDGNVGFEVLWEQTYPKLNDWVEAVGVLELYQEMDSEYLRLRLTSLKVLDERGTEYVVN